MNIKDIIEKPVTELTDDELVARINALRSARIASPKRKSNIDRRLMDLLSKSDKDMLAKITNIIKEACDGTKGNPDRTD